MSESKHGPWEVAHIYGGGMSIWQVYRLRDVNEVDHSGNREYAGPVFGSEPEAKVWLEANRKALPE